MKTYLDCIACFMRQALDAARMASDDLRFHEQVVRQALRWAASMDLGLPPPVMGQQIHRFLRRLTGGKDPYYKAKQRQNRLAAELLPEMEAMVREASDPLGRAVRLAIAANVIDMGAKGELGDSDIRRAMYRAVQQPVYGSLESFRAKAAAAGRILYLADNAGEIVFDRLLIECLGPGRVTLVVRGAPVINDATVEDAKAAGLDRLVDVIDNGSDAPGTILDDCSPEFRRRIQDADLVLAKGQGNFETLSSAAYPIIFLFKAKCPVIARHAGLAVGSHVLLEADYYHFVR